MPRKVYLPGKPIKGFKAGQGMSIGMNGSKKKVEVGGAEVDVAYHVTLTTKSEGGRGAKANNRTVDHFHITFETSDGTKIGQYNYTVKADGSFAKGTWGGNTGYKEEIDALGKLAASHSKKMAKVVAT